MLLNWLGKRWQSKRWRKNFPSVWQGEILGDKSCWIHLVLGLILWVVLSVLFFESYNNTTFMRELAFPMLLLLVSLAISALAYLLWYTAGTTIMCVSRFKEEK